jgi:hypothetical protein
MDRKGIRWGDIIEAESLASVKFDSFAPVLRINAFKDFQLDFSDKKTKHWKRWKD